VKRLNIFLTFLLVAFLVRPQTDVLAQTDPPVVHAVLFYSPTCGHCEYVINNTLLPMLEQYGGQLQIAGIDVSQQQGQAFFMSAMQRFNLDSAGVPFLVIENTYLVGSLDIPEKFPSMVETYLAQGGVDWPEISGLTELLDVPQDAPEPTASAQSEALPAAPQPASTPQSSTSPTEAPSLPGVHTDTSSWRDKFARDPLGNSLSVILLLGMIASMVWAVYFFQRTGGISIKANWARIIPVLCLIGFGVAGYLAYVETTQTTAVCGPVGDCNTVQQSEYARLFGILPIGVLGLVGYLAIFISWLVARLSNGRPAELAVLAIFFMTALGTLFSIYLTFLEPFVIGATCAWCLTSAILMTALMLLSVGPAKLVFARKNT
jgi:uncharacterized membrane protein/thiol-disulfide isomerase/thioredoxin